MLNVFLDLCFYLWPRRTGEIMDMLAELPRALWYAWFR